MIRVDSSAQSYFLKLLNEHDVANTGVRVRAMAPGTPKGDCRLEFCEPEDVSDQDWEIQCEGFSLYIDQQSAPFLDGAEVTFEDDGVQGRMVIKAPKLKGVPPDAQASLVERVQYVIDTEVNPQVASHGGRVSLVEIGSDGTVVLRFGGGCHGCGMVGVTLREGVERTLRERVPEISAVVDATDHDSGAAPYYKRGEKGASVV